MRKKPIIISIICFIIDFISKLLITKYFDLYESKVIIKDFFNLTLVHNNGAAFSIFENKQILFILIACIAVFYIFNYLNKNVLKSLEVIAFSLIAGGILGNLFDRIVYGYVIDFFDFNIFGYDFAVFNIADSFIVIGVILLIIESMREYYGKRNRSNK